MRVQRAGQEPTTPGPADEFTGQAWATPMIAGDAPARQSVARVVFAPDARTAWHTHPLGQLLIATAGIGRVQADGEPIMELRAGDAVSIGPGERHWHGAAPGARFEHLEVHGSTERGTGAEWLDPVSDHDYEAGPVAGETDEAARRSRPPVTGEPSDRAADPDRAWNSWAFTDEERWSNEDVRAFELDRARHALARIKGLIGDDGMLALLDRDIAAQTEQVRDWVAASAGAWRSSHVELVVPGPPAAHFHAWYRAAMTNLHEADLRAGHPEHWISRPRPDGIEVVENIGETGLPWRVLYRPTADDAYPTPWDLSYPVRFGSELVDQHGLLVGYTQHALRDEDDGVHVVMTSTLPAAVPDEVAARHLRHYAIEFRNWCRTATRWIASGGHEPFGTGIDAHATDTTTTTPVPGPTERGDERDQT